MKNHTGSVFFVKLPCTQQLCRAVVQVMQEKCCFHSQVLRCRQLLCSCRDVLAAPHTHDKTLIDVVMQASFYKTKFGALCKKLNLKPVRAEVAHSTVIENCVTYTMKFRLTPLWVEAGRNLINNPDFLTCHGKMKAANVEVCVKQNEMTIHVRPRLVRLPPPCLESFAICTDALEKFSTEADFVINECFINLSWCHILPTMKRGQVVRISRRLPQDGDGEKLFKDYEGMRKYWRNQYGYRLPAEESDVIYCSVYFTLISSHMFTYPLMCLRSRPAQFMPRCDEASIVKSFITALHQKMNNICGLPLTYSRQPCFLTTSLTSSLQILVEKAVNSAHNLFAIRNMRLPSSRFISRTMKPNFPVNVQLDDRSEEITSEEKPQTVPDNARLLVTNKRLTSSTHCVPSRTDVIPASQVDSGKHQGGATTTNEDVQSAMRVTLQRHFPKTSEGKFVPVFGNRLSKSRHSTPAALISDKLIPRKKQKINTNSSLAKKHASAMRPLPPCSNSELEQKSSSTPSTSKTLGTRGVKRKVGVSKKKSVAKETIAPALTTATSATNAEPDNRIASIGKSKSTCNRNPSTTGKHKTMIGKDAKNDRSGAPALDSGTCNAALASVSERPIAERNPAPTPASKVKKKGSPNLLNFHATSSVQAFDAAFSKASTKNPARPQNITGSSKMLNPDISTAGSARKFDQLFSCASSASS